PDTTNTKMILKVLPYARKVLNRMDPQALQFGPVANSRLHQHLRRMDPTQRQNHLRCRTDANALPVVSYLNSSGALPLERHAGDERRCKHRQVWPIHIGEGVRTERGKPFPVVDSNIQDGGAASALHHAAVMALESWNSH